MALLSAMTVAAHARTTATTAYVDLIVNGQHRPEIVELSLGGDSMTLAGADLRAAGIMVSGDEPVELIEAGLSPRYDALNQRLELTVPLALLAVSRRAGPARERALAQSATGAAFNYDAFVLSNDMATSLSLWSEQRLFGPFGHVAHTGVIRVGTGEAGSGLGYLRYDTRFRHVDADRALALTVGDFVTGGLSWSRPVRLGGVQIGRNFRSRPDLVTTPLPRFAGEAAVPSAVDLFIDGHRQQTQTVDPGRFVLENMPVVSGAGIATIVTTDAVGRQIVTDIPFYVAPELLRPGLTDFSASVGAIRRNYGLTSFDYGMIVGSAFLRQGVSDRLTVEAQGEASARSLAAGAGAVWAPGLFGTLHANLTASSTDGVRGTQATIGYQYAAKRWSLSAEHRRISGGFRTAADFDLRALPLGGTSSRAVVSANLEQIGTIGIGYIDSRPRGAARSRIATASWSLPLGSQAALFAAADYDLERGTASAQLRVSVPFGGGTASSGLSREQGRGWVGQVEFSRSAPYAGGIGLAAGVALDERGRVFGQADATARTAKAQFNVGGSIAGGRHSLWGGASGSVVLIDGGLFAANDISDSFAVVSTNGVEGVPVYYENQHVGTTDRRGHVLVPRIPAYHPSSFTIDPMQLDAGFVPQAVKRRVAIAEGGAAIIDLPIRAMRSITLTLVDALSAPIEAGSLVRLGNGAATVIGWDGVLYIEDASGAQRVAVTRPDGSHCSAAISTPHLQAEQGTVVPCL